MALSITSLEPPEMLESNKNGTCSYATVSWGLDSFRAIGLFLYHPGFLMLLGGKERGEWHELARYPLNAVFCKAKQMTGFYMKRITGLTWVNRRCVIEFKI